jgi:hypothetical protein
MRRRSLSSTASHNGRTGLLAHPLGPFTRANRDLLDTARELLRRTFPVGIVETEDQPAALPREQMIEHRRADIAGMDPPRLGEADCDAHA